MQPQGPFVLGEGKIAPGAQSIVTLTPREPGVRLPYDVRNSYRLHVLIELDNGFRVLLGTYYQGLQPFDEPIRGVVFPF